MSETNTSAMQVGSIPIVKTLSITNSSSAEIVLLNSASEDPGLHAYEENLTLMTDTNGRKSLPAGSTATVALDTTGIGPSYSQVYTTIFARSSNLFPVKITGSAPSYRSGAYDPVTVTDDDAAAMAQAERFLQTITAYPTSSLARNYAQLLQDTRNATGTDTDIDSAFARFFAPTSYPKVSMEAISAVGTYYTQFPNVWAAYQPSMKHDLYCSNDKNTADYAGSVTITLPAVASADKSLPGYGLTFTDPAGASKPLYFINGQFVDSKSGTADICLSGTFMLKSTITRVAADNAIVPVLTGVISNKKVLGYAADNVATASNGTDGSGPHSGLDGFDIFLIAIGSWLGLSFALALGASVVTAIKEKIEEYKESVKESSESDDPDFSELLTGEKLAELKSEAESDTAPLKEKLQKQLDDVQADFGLDGELADLFKEYEPQVDKMYNEEEKNLFEDEAGTIQTELGEELDAGVNSTELQDDEDTIESALEKIDAATPEELAGVLQTEQPSMDEVKADVDANYKKALSEAEGDAKTELTEVSNELKEMEAEEDNIEKEKEEEETGDTKDTEFTENDKMAE
ncbi:hypothetical protein FEM33_17250 [Dyadobacter flavalbus]|uniref:Uncharacterized protein n=1 Tax=Dyadobacter flavalbus TaxID=2579942 RepID=A0A5M8QUC7_9BACT|nr:hypothetical protein [Dyadobacter flavalbus]KAA6438434.1 hypothetical protein FEM33_17250 [Dyadobacter flavalbus]